MKAAGTPYTRTQLRKDLERVEESLSGLAAACEQLSVTPSVHDKAKRAYAFAHVGIGEILAPLRTILGKLKGARK